MLLLALDTSTSAITVALHDGTAALASESVLDARAHAEHLAPAVRTVLTRAGARPSEVSALAAGTGPGPFTGLRVGLVTAATLGYAWDVPTYGVCSLDVLAYQAWITDPVACADGLIVGTDARRREVYWARYAPSGAPTTVGEAGPLRRIGGPGVGRAADLALTGAPTVGRGALLYPEGFGTPLGPLDVDAAALAGLVITRLAAGAAFDGLEPRYLRRPDALTTAERTAAPST